MNYLVKTPCGTLQGCEGRVPGTAAYKGIRYATAGRWEYPTQVTAWEGIYDATHYGNCSYQPRAFYNEAESAEKAFYYNEFRKGETYTYSEDCLFLNIFTPDTAQEGDDLPVLIYIHGGGFTGGCGHEKHFDGPVWPDKGVIGVTLNYRLGPLGFACLPELKQEAGITGNYGLFDQLTAMRWVKDNIASFGGDPENITIMGQSAGAMSVQQHCLSPLSEGLFQKAVMSSGGGVSKLMSAQLPEKTYDFWHAVMEAAGCQNLEAFRALPVQTLFATWQNLKKSMKGGQPSPCLDGRLVVGTGAELLKAGKQHPISYMAGSTSEDVMPPVIYQMGKNWCAAQEKPSYAWFFDRRLPGDDNGAWHSSDLWYWFGTLENCWRPMTRKDHVLSNQMTSYLTNFCKYGDPNGAGLTAWLPMGKSQSKVLCLGEADTHMGKADMLKLTKTMLTNKAVGE
ncbi:MAG: carboxylesterase family protein [Oscillospiraceae bacterium]|nr:carboxylesterase family protein [Oscillospiraceae bacterium]